MYIENLIDILLVFSHNMCVICSMSLFTRKLFILDNFISQSSPFNLTKRFSKILSQIRQGLELRVGFNIPSKCPTKRVDRTNSG